MNQTSKTAERFVLWYRGNKYDRWREVDSAPTEAELTKFMVKLPSGETITLPTVEDEQELRLMNESI